MRHLSILLFSVIHLGAALPTSRYQSVDHRSGPTVSIQNGTLVGTTNIHYQQDFFLGIPYAAPPVKQLRLRRPSPASSWASARHATSYSARCIGNSINLAGFSQNTTDPMSEDCLYLNVVRPSGILAADKVPVLIWIHGGALLEGSASDGRSNGTFLVEISVRMGTPVIFVSFNYRLGAFGILAGREVEAAGLANLALHDQRQALVWIQENIAHFGGDTSRVTIMGESAGAGSVGFHLLAYGGRNDGLFSAAIAQSGGPQSTLMTIRTASERESDFEIVLQEAGCENSRHSLDCLRKVPAEVMRQAGQRLPTSIAVDGDMVRHSGTQLRQGHFVRVPLLIGTTRNEGTSFVQQTTAQGPINTEEDFIRVVEGSLGNKAVPKKAIRRWAELYQLEVDAPSGGGLGTVLPNPGANYGSQYGKTTLWMGDVMFTAGRRRSSQAWANHQVPSYSYLFDTVPAIADPQTLGAAHFLEMPNVFGNTEGVGWTRDPFPSDPVQRQKHYTLADIVSQMWISFTVTGSSNFHQVPDFNITWPIYQEDDPQNMVFSASLGSHLQPDTWRAEAFDMLSQYF
ncbi:hypothetical protein LCI18_009632 [Fusarium solani-melongenae]|uniref:Uncharacterized protein n=1 Tax=Fusarium solani subsp. cucurbitae TaxID=2747967 RepID=A0ACD3ZC25_FUSSC|nr:hypothetical protein LCI18_009632 [Fusarium solani-melongenae]